MATSARPTGHRCFDLLSVDTEGNELDVLESMELGEFLPSLIAVEIHDFEIAMPKKNPIYTLLVRHGYHLVGFLPPYQLRLQPAQEPTRCRNPQ